MTNFIPIEFQKIKEKTNNKFIRILASYQPNLSLTASKFAGIPYFPKQQEFPVDINGHPLRLLVQINFSELPKQSLLPSTGLLQIFIPKNDKTYGVNFIDHSKSQFVVHFWKDTAQPSQQIIPIELEDDLFPIYGQHQLSFQVEQNAASFESIEFTEIAQQNPIELLEDIALDDTEATQFYQSYNDSCNLAGHKMLGHAFFPDFDPRQNSDWVLLLQIDSDLDQDNDIIWGDQGSAQFFIQKEHLKQENFEHLWYFWQD